MIVNLRPVNSFVTPGRPARALRQARSVIRITDENPAVDLLLLKMALKAKCRVPSDQHSLIH
jgi:hypothetical protein